EIGTQSVYDHLRRQDADLLTDKPIYTKSFTGPSKILWLGFSVMLILAVLLHNKYKIIVPVVLFFHMLAYFCLSVCRIKGLLSSNFSVYFNYFGLAVSLGGMVTIIMYFIHNQ
ncbi:MAG: hypothetical protein CVU68_10430, partial [Deltaproteobacteria bacterium HGW-Deltaproteobacteria-3]